MIHVFLTVCVILLFCSANEEEYKWTDKQEGGEREKISNEMRERKREGGKKWNVEER